MSDLDKKLKNLDIEFLHGVPVHLPDSAVEAIKQAILDWIDKEIIGEDETGSNNDTDNIELQDKLNDRKFSRNNLRAEMRRKLGR